MLCDRNAAGQGVLGKTHLVRHADQAGNLRLRGRTFHRKIDLQSVAQARFRPLQHRSLFVKMGGNFHTFIADIDL